MSQLREVRISSQPLDRFLPLLGEARVREAREICEEARKAMDGRVFWHVNSAARGGGVAEILQSLLPYSRRAGIDTRWVVLSGKAEFFRITKRLHNALHGSTGDGSALGDRERAVYEDVLRGNTAELLQSVRPRDVVFLHDPQTAGMAPELVRAGAIVVWRCHIGQEKPNAEVDRGWRFLAPYLETVAAAVFSRDEYRPAWFDRDRSIVIAPSIDPFTAKNQDMDDDTVRAILSQAGVIEASSNGAQPVFTRQNGSTALVERQAEITRNGHTPSWDTPLVAQISRWDHLKDPVGVITGFARMNGAVPADAELVLAGPREDSVSDDPESASVLEEMMTAWRDLPPSARDRVHIVSLPMDDIEENAAIVNALQRHAAVVVQKSLDEGFGLTVTEAMWKSRPVVATAVGGIQDQITDGVHGLLLDDPTHLEEFGDSLHRLLSDRPFAERLGEKARERVRVEYLGLRHVTQYAELLLRLDGSGLSAGAS